jgi:integrase
MVPVDGTAQPVSGHIFRRSGKRGHAWYAKYRLPDGRQVKKRIGPHWSQRGTAPPPGYFTKRTAQAWLDSTLAKARLGEFGGIASTHETVADAVNEWLGYVELDRQRKPSTLVDYRHMANRIKADLGKRRTDRVTAELIEDYRDELVRQGLSHRTVL